MARQPKSMRQIKEILRLKNEPKLSVRGIAGSCAVAASTVGDYLKRAEAAGLGWPIREEWTEDEILERLLGAAEPAPVGYWVPGFTVAEVYEPTAAAWSSWCGLVRKAKPVLGNDQSVGQRMRLFGQAAGCSGWPAWP
jgi:hypothetical protein